MFLGASDLWRVVEKWRTLLRLFNNKEFCSSLKAKPVYCSICDGELLYTSSYEWNEILNEQARPTHWGFAFMNLMKRTVIHENISRNKWAKSLKCYKTLLLLLHKANLATLWNSLNISKTGPTYIYTYVPPVLKILTVIFLTFSPAVLKWLFQWAMQSIWVFVWSNLFNYSIIVAGTKGSGKKCCFAPKGEYFNSA